MHAVAVGLHGRDGSQFQRPPLGAQAAGHGAGRAHRLGAPGRAVPQRGARGKNDANDAAAICEAASRPHMRFVPVKGIEQQSLLCVHRLREGVKADRTACINRIRGLLLEFDIAVATGVRALQTTLHDILEDAGNELNGLARMTLQRAHAQWRELDEHLAWCDARLGAHTANSAEVQRAADLMGVGPITASAAVATVGDFKQFDSGAQFGAWPGLVPKQRSSGGKGNLGTITKRGDADLRTLLVQGAKSGGQHRPHPHRADQPLGVCAERKLGLAEGRGGARQQERAHPVGGDDARAALRPTPRQHQACRSDTAVPRRRSDRGCDGVNQLPCTTT